MDEWNKIEKNKNVHSLTSLFLIVTKKPKESEAAEATEGS
jgi:hypothetical protein